MCFELDVRTEPVASSLFGGYCAEVESGKSGFEEGLIQFIVNTVSFAMATRCKAARKDQRWWVLSSDMEQC